MDFDNLFDINLLSKQQKLLVVIGYFRKHELIDYKIKIDDFVDIVEQYIYDKSIQFDDSRLIDDIFKHKSETSCKIRDFDIINNNFFAVINQSTKYHNESEMYVSIYLYCM